MARYSREGGRGTGRTGRRRSRQSPVTLLIEVCAVLVLGFVLYQIGKYYFTKGRFPDVMSQKDFDALVGNSKETLARAKELSQDAVEYIDGSITKARERWKKMNKSQRKNYVGKRLDTYEKKDDKYIAAVKKSPAVARREPSPTAKDPEMERALAEYQKGRIALRRAHDTKKNADYKTAEAHFRLALGHLKQAKDRQKAEKFEPEVAMLLYAAMKSQTVRK